MVWYVVNQYEEVMAGPFKRVQDARLCARRYIMKDEDFEVLVLSHVKNRYERQDFWGDMVVGIHYSGGRALGWECVVCKKDKRGRRFMLTYLMDAKGNLKGKPVLVEPVVSDR